jgi:hypothetical protein
MALFSVHDSVWSDTGRGANHQFMERKVLERSFSVTPIEVDRETHAKVEVVVEHLKVPGQGGDAGFAESDRDVFIVRDGQILWPAQAETRPTVLGSGGVSGFEYGSAIRPFSVPISSSQNAVMLDMGYFPAAEGGNDYRAFAFCDGATLSEMQGAPSTEDGSVDFPDEKKSSVKLKNEISYAVTVHIWAGCFDYVRVLLPDLRRCAYDAVDDHKGIFPVDRFYPEAEENRQDTSSIRLFESPDSAAKSKRVLIRSSDKVTPIEVRTLELADDRPGELYNRAEWLHIRINKKVEGWVSGDNFNNIGLEAAQ